MSKESIEIALNACVLLLCFYLAFFKSYIQEKGKNLATTEDIQKITVLVEQAKKQFNEDLELLKNHLSLYNQNFVDIKTLERNALIEINTRYSEWFNSLSTFALAYYSYDNYETLKSKDLYFGEKHLAFNVAEDNLHLFVHDQELMDKKNDLIQLTFKLHESTLRHITNFMLNCQNYNDKRAIVKEDEQLALNKEYHEIQQGVVDSSLAESTKIQLEIMPKQIEFIKNLNHKIYKLIKSQK